MIEKIDEIKIVDKINTQPSFKNDYVYYIENPSILADLIVEIYNNNPNANVYMSKKEIKLNCNML